MNFGQPCRGLRTLLLYWEQVGRGNRPVEWISELLAARDRSMAPGPAPPGGLYLAEVK